MKKKIIIMSNSNRMFDIRALGGFKSNDMSFGDFVRNVAKSGVSVGNAYMGKVSFAGGLPEAYTEGTMTVMILTGGLVKYIFNAPSVPYGEYECYSKDGGEPTEWSAGSGGGVADLMVETTYGELKSLRDSGGLVPGMQYRITDYECTTTMNSTRSANHQFDIIVTADTETVLNENARAINHYEEPTVVAGIKFGFTVNTLVELEWTKGSEKYYGVLVPDSKKLGDGNMYYSVGYVDSGASYYTLESEGVQPYNIYTTISEGGMPSFETTVENIYSGLTLERIMGKDEEPIQMVFNGNEVVVDGSTYYSLEAINGIEVSILKQINRGNGIPYYEKMENPDGFVLWSTVTSPSSIEELYIMFEGDRMIPINQYIEQYEIPGFFDVSTIFEPTDILLPYDDYFAESSLKSWEIKYSLDNDANRFDWALDGIQPAPSLTAFLFWEDEEGEEYVYTHYEVNAEYIEWWEEVLNSTEEDEQVPIRGAKASGQHVFTGVNSQYDGGVYNASDLKNKVGQIKEMKVEEQPTKAFLTWWYKDEEGKQQYVTFYECKIDEKAGLIYWHNGDSSEYKECYTYTKLAVWSGKDYPETLVYSDKSFKTPIGYISQYSLPSSKKGTLDWKDGDTDRTYNSYYVYNNGSNKRVVAWTGEDISDKQEGDYGQNTVYTYCPPSDYSETDPQESGYVYSSDSLDDRTRLRGPANIGTIQDFDMPVIPTEETRGVVLRETAESEPTYISGKGVIYYMKDEYGNECQYDFKNIMFKRSTINKVLNGRGTVYGSHPLVGLYGLDNNRISCDSTEEKYYYTFSTIDSDGLINDASLSFSYDVGSGEGYGAGKNVIGSTFDGKYQLGNNVFVEKGLLCYNNKFGENVSRNTFNGSFMYNTFGDSIYDNTFGDEIEFNTFGGYIHTNCFGDEIKHNRFDTGTFLNTFGSTVLRNVTGVNFTNNTFYNGVYANSFGNDVSFNEFPIDTDSNTFGNQFYYNTFGKSILYRCTFGNRVYQNTFDNDIRQITVDDCVNYNDFGKNMKALTVFSGVRYCNIKNESDKYIQNCQILNGVQGKNQTDKMDISFTPDGKVTQVAYFPTERDAESQNVTISIISFV